VIDYDREAASYDDSRGGPERAAAVASAVAPLLAGGLLVDVACGTGIVSALLSDAAAAPARTGPSGIAGPGDAGGIAGPGDAGGIAGPGDAGGIAGPAAMGGVVLGVDRSPGMLAVAATRLPGRVMLGDATRLPLSSGSVGTVLMVWLLHLLPASEPALGEAVRVLRAGGRVITTVDKSAAYFAVPSDLAEATAAWRGPSMATDRFDRVAGFLGRRGLHPVGEGTFPGIGQARSPRHWREAVRTGRVSWARDDPGGVERALAGLPDQDRARPEPVYRLVAFTAGPS
jgi:ubiquinone/menaquinone biosynthesis C-methylase UbiE